MCGFFGEIGQGSLTDAHALDTIAQTLHHRGPDDEGFATGDGWMLGFRRLSILDLSADGHQPMRSPNGRYIMVFNGEIYNFLELRQELENDGEQFQSGTDTEVLLRLLIREGPQALQRCNGMFALAFLDLQERRFLLARDRLGVKPLYLRLDDGKLRFASELKALLEWPNAPRQLNRSALREYLALGYIPGSTCIFKGYEKLLPGHFAVGSLDNPTLSPQRYWEVDIQPSNQPEADDETLLAQLDALLDDAVSLRLRSDVPIAVLLSGGIDSGLVASYMAHSETAPIGLVAGFSEPDFDETALAKATADHLGIELQSMQLSASNLADVDRLAVVFDEPFGDPSAIPTMKICEAARRHAIVMLTGDGGDEAFGGYRRYIEARKYRAVMAIPNWVRRMLWRLGKGRLSPRNEYKLTKAMLPGDRLAAVFDGLGLVADPALALILPDDLVNPAETVVASVTRAWGKGTRRDLLSRQRMFDYNHYLPDDVLVKVDRASMAHSTEIRSPFLDYRVVEFAAKLPDRVLVRAGKGKLMLRRLAKHRLPHSVAVGGKKGFGVPVGDWVRQPEGQAFIRERLMDPAKNSHNLWQIAGVEKLLKQHLAQQRDYGDYFWRLLMLQAWANRYLTKAPE